jgi:NDP-sugar pyrophosphorylase family protein
MQIVIPMSGFGERFRRAGYSMPKPLIEIDDKPIIAHVINMFPGEQDFLFICSNEHLENPIYRMREILHKYCPTGRIIGIPPHKFGPIYAVRQVQHLIDSTRPVVVNYCDFSCYWNWEYFKNFVFVSCCDGAIPAYKGFHPHTLGTTNYAYLRESAGRVLDIQEKQPFTQDRMEEYASSGTYYFSTGHLMKEAFAQAIEQDLNVNGEYYVSLAYKPLLQSKCKILIYPLQHFMQWGTPEDVAEYNGWSLTFKRLVEPEKRMTELRGSVIIPMAGLGTRFSSEGYEQPKPLIPVSGLPMVIQAVNCLPLAINYVFVLREDMQGHSEIVNQIKEVYPNAVIQYVKNVTEGQACTALIGLDTLRGRISQDLGPVTIAACDNGVLYDSEELNRLINDSKIDVIVWGFRGHANAFRNPEMFGWIEALDGGKITNISVKTPMGSPESDAIVIGAFTFKRADDFREVVHQLIARDSRVNGEYYIDSCINDAIKLGLNCHLFEVDSMISWGTPNDLKTYEYWQSCFDKWTSHPYEIDRDNRVPVSARKALKAKYVETLPEIYGEINGET